MMDHEEIYRKVTGTLGEMFQLNPETLTKETRLMEDLDLDSIDAIDMAVKVQEITGKRLRETELVKIKTVGDIVDVVHDMLTVKTGKGD